MIIMKTKAQKSELQNDDIFDYLSISACYPFIHDI